MLDLVITDALVVDGTGAPGFPGSVGIQGDTLMWVGHAGTAAPEARERLHATGRVLAPGFVDVHNHSDLGPLVDPAMPSTIRQGVTTVVVGNCGSSPWPPDGAPECARMVGGDPDTMDVRFASFADYLERIEASRPAVNIAALVGHGAIRATTMGLEGRPPTSRELGSMRSAVAEAMQAGAVGLSTGLIYAPGIHAQTDEVVALARESAVAGGIYASHIRGEGAHLFRAIDEANDVGERAEVPVHISHLKCETSPMWGRAGEVLRRIDGARDITADQYPYTAWGSDLSSLLPGWAPVGELSALIADPSTHGRLVRAVEDGEADFQSSVLGVGWSQIVIEGSGDGSRNGWSIEAIARDRGVAAADACFALLMEDPDTSCIGHAMDEGDVRTILGHPDVMVASDASSMSPDGPLGDRPVHPRNYGTFPRVIGPYVRDGVLTLEAAVRKMTSLPADRFGLTRRGLVVEGAAADLVLFDLATVTDASDFGHPHTFPDGIDLVLVNGRRAWDGAPGVRAGRVLRRAAS